MSGSRGNTSARGYGTKHQRLRKRWATQVEQGVVTCWRCGHLIRPGAAWDLGHDDHDRSTYRGPEHRSCNRATAGRKGWRRPPPAPKPRPTFISFNTREFHSEEW